MCVAGGNTSLPHIPNTRPRSPMTRDPDIPNSFRIFRGGGDIVCTMHYESTNRTESDLPGPGRLLGKLYSSLGRRLERGINAIAVRRGYGPLSAAERFRSKYGRRGDVRDETSVKGAQDRKDCKKLIRYTKYSMFLFRQAPH